MQGFVVISVTGLCISLDIMVGTPASDQGLFNCPPVAVGMDGGLARSSQYDRSFSRIISACEEAI